MRVNPARSLLHLEGPSRTTGSFFLSPEHTSGDRQPLPVFSFKPTLAGPLCFLKNFISVSGLQSSAPSWVHNLFYLTMGTMFLVSTVLCVKIHKKLQRMKKYNLKVPLIFDQQKKATSFQQVRSNDRYEEVRASVRQTTPKGVSKEPHSSVGGCGPEQPEFLPPCGSAGVQTP